MNATDKLDRILRRDAAEDIADEGFAARVMAALPAREPRRQSGLNPTLVLGSAAVGSLLAVAFAPANANILQGMIDLYQHHALTPAAYVSIGMSAILLVSAALLARDA
ncbi:MAG TPA: hypothetical protein VKR38_09780 [Usitatibacter sp.]|nr:hypothetical protein [Usitatibacter sp.]